MNILSKLVKLKFEENDTHKQEDMEWNKYMNTLLAMPPAPQIVVSMEWDWGVESADLLKLLLMSHFGWST